MTLNAEAQLLGDDERPTILPARVRAPEHVVAQFSADIWPLAALGIPASQNNPSLDFSKLPSPFRAVAKKLLWLIINCPAPDLLRQRNGRPTTDFPTASTVMAHLAGIRLFVIWLAQQPGCPTFSAVTEELLEAYALMLANKKNESGRYKGRAITGTYRLDLLNAVTRIYAHADALPLEDRLITPPWFGENMSALRSKEGRNRTEQLSEDVYAPLLRWALVVVEEFSGDIIRALNHRASLDATAAAAPACGIPAARDILRRFVAEHGYLPEVSGRSIRQGDVATGYLAAIYAQSNGGSFSHVLNRDRDLALRNTPTRPYTPLDIEISARLAGRPWLDWFNYYDTEYWQDTLATACLITIGLLLGARPDELLTLQVGAVERVEQPNGQVKWLVRGRLRKGQRDLKGRQLLEGVEVAWVTTGEAAHAASILAELYPASPWAFPSLRRSKGSLDTPLRSDAATVRLANFIAAVNRLAAEHDLPLASQIPEAGITTSRFRRTTLALLSDQPGGLMVAAHQAKHAIGPVVELTGMNTTGGYTYSDANEQLAAEHRREVAIAATMRVVNEITEGSGVSGPAASRLAQIASDPTVTFARYLPERQLRSALRNTGQVVYDNPSTLMLCVFDPLQAQCADPSSPNFGTCRLQCPNHAMLDSNRPGLEQRATDLRAQAESEPAVPKAAAKRRLAASYERVIERHDQGALHV